MAVTVQVRKVPEKSAAVVEVGGQVHLLEAKELENRLEDIMRKGEQKIILDMSEVTFIASDGLGVLIRLRGDAKARGGFLKIVHPQHQVLGIFRTTRLTKLFDIYSSTKEALASF